MGPNNYMISIGNLPIQLLFTNITMLVLYAPSYKQAVDSLIHLLIYEYSMCSMIIYILNHPVVCI